MNIFGFEIKRPGAQEVQQSVVAPALDDGATVVNSAAGYYAQVVNLEATIRNENDIIRRYREISQYPDCDSAIDDITNEAIVAEEDSAPVEIVLDDLKIPENIKKKITDEFENVLSLLKFDQRGHDIFRSWYIDGRMYYQVLVDEANVKNGIVELRPIDPRKIRKIKNVKRERNPQGVEIVTEIEEYYIYNDKGITEGNVKGVKLALDSVIHVPSGLVDQNTGMSLSYLHKAIKLVNQLKMMEDALVIYRISRAPERRIFYVDVGNLPKMKAEQYVNDLMNKFKNKVVYDATTGEVRDDRKHLSMMEDFWMPRREGGKGTEITTLPGGQTLGQIEDIQFFQNKLYQALNVPMSRLKGDQGFNLGRSSEITRDEIKFTKFIQRIRKRFSNIFLDALRLQLILKGIINPEDWDDFSQKIRFDFIKDNHFSEIKDAEIIQGRLNILSTIDPFVGKYYSPSYVKKHILRLNDEEIKEIDTENDEHNAQKLDNELGQTLMRGQAQAEVNNMQSKGEQ
jgi:Bacteriophage T4-like portal protein (Gp20)